MNKKLELRVLFTLTIALVLILITASQALAFTYFVTPINNTITKQEIARFELIIRNTADFDDFFTISTRDVNWIVNAEPGSGVVTAGQDAEFVVELRPKPLLREGLTYIIPIKIKSEKTGFHFEEKEKFAVYVVSPDQKPGVYVPTVTPTIYIDQVVDPRQKVAVRLNLRNRNLRDLDGLKVVISGEILYKEYTTHLLPLEEKFNEILFEVDPFVEAGTKTLTLTLFFEDKKIAESSTQYEVQGYLDMQETSTKKSFLFRTRESITIYNKGNEKGVAEKSFRINFFKRLFTSFSPSPVKEGGTDGKTYYVIRQELSSEEHLDIEIITNYRLLVLIIILIIVGVVLYYTLRSPIVIIKSAEPLGRTKEGVSEIKISLYLKNRSRRPITNLRVVDTVPRIAEIEKKTRLGSMEPVNIGKSRRGTVAKWELDVLEPYEERIITYRVKSKLQLVGGIRLPSAKAKFDARKGKERVTYSNNVNLVHKE
ncbi:hypothetical protein KY348_06445 [Candidatus Woesearchaeota archaeon]|nr:hypothetical protein [Candidatus Woesearchaeota archaeon]